MRAVSLCLVLFIIGSSFGFKQTGHIEVSGDEYGTSCSINDTRGLVYIYVNYYYGPPAKSISFQAPIPSCAIGLTLISESAQFSSIVGDSQTGITINFDGCVSPPQTLLTMLFVGNGTSEDCCLIVPQAHPNSASGRIEIVDCNNNVILAGGHPGLINPAVGCYCHPDMIMPEVSNPSPPDGADDVPINIDLSWDRYDPEHPYADHTMYFGTQSDPPQIPGVFSEDNYDPGILNPWTTYYWSVLIWRNARLVKGPIWSFTTGRGMTPIRPTTWGRIKALYS
jgi:hypothetical protein